MKKIKAFLSLIRVKHYLKNVLVFVPLVFALELTNVELLLKAVVGFVAFSLGASVVYIVNDVRDVEKDRQHSTKCRRPIASGAISVKAAIVSAVLLTLVSAGLLVWMGNLLSAVILLVYLALNFAYSFGLKNIPILDLVILASGFVLRVLFGGAITGIPVSQWLLLVMAAGALYLGMGKRRGEILREGESTRTVNRLYNVGFLERNMYLCLALTIVFYALWCLTSETIAGFANPSLIIWSVIFVLVIVIRYNYIVEGDSDGDPVSVLVHDPMLMVLAVLYVAYMILAIYVPMGIGG
ncbi:MAG: decaprenyl-phosphate phosphoribosyltransferase [Christensenellaceae bacterium]